MRRIEIIDENTGEFLEEKITLDIHGIELTLDLLNDDLDKFNENVGLFGKSLVLNMIYSYPYNKFFIKKNTDEKILEYDKKEFTLMITDVDDDDALIKAEKRINDLLKEYIIERKFKFGEYDSNRLHLSFRNYIGERVDNVLFINAIKGPNYYVGDVEYNSRNISNLVFKNVTSFNKTIKSVKEYNDKELNLFYFVMELFVDTIKYAMKNNIKEICLSQDTIVDYWSKNQCNSKVGKIQEMVSILSKLRNEFENNGGMVYMKCFDKKETLYLA